MRYGLCISLLCASCIAKAGHEAGADVVTRQDLTGVKTEIVGEIQAAADTTIEAVGRKVQTAQAATQNGLANIQKTDNRVYDRWLPWGLLALLAVVLLRLVKTRRERARVFGGSSR